VKTRVRVLLLVVAAAVVALAALIGRGAYIVLHNLTITPSTAITAAAQFSDLRRHFPERAPLIQIDDPLRARVHVNHPPRSAPLTHLDGFEILVWQADEQKLVRTRAPLWMMRMSTLSLLSQVGLAPSSLQLTVDDVERYGPGVILDFTSPKGDRALVVAR
jgi:hypothetical protein